MNKKILALVLAAVLVGFALGVAGGPKMSALGTHPVYALEAGAGGGYNPGGGPGGPGGPGGGPGMPGGPGMGGPQGMRPMGGPPSFPMTANSSFVYILMGDTLYQYDAKSLKFVAKTKIEMPQPPQGMGQPMMGGPMGQ